MGAVSVAVERVRVGLRDERRVTGVRTRVVVVTGEVEAALDAGCRGPNSAALAGSVSVALAALYAAVVPGPLKFACV